MTALPIACNLEALTSEQRAREQALLEEFRACLRQLDAEAGLRFEVPDDPALLARLGELLALERLCCPFLDFELSVPANRGPITLHIGGAAGTQEFARATFRGR